MRRTLFALLLFAISQGAFAQKTITGKVMNAEDGLGMNGVFVVVKGTSTGVVTNSDGNFTMNVPNDATIVVAYTGFRSVEISVGAQTQFEIRLQPDVRVMTDQERMRLAEARMRQEEARMRQDTARMRQSEAFVVNRGDFVVMGVPRVGAGSETLRLNVTKVVNDSSFSEEYSFNIGKTAKSVVMTVAGNCTAGVINVRLQMPNSNVYFVNQIESGNVNWRRTITISETENQDKIGDWKCQVSSNNATGNFMISIQVN